MNPSSTITGRRWITFIAFIALIALLAILAIKWRTPQRTEPAQDAAEAPALATGPFNTFPSNTQPVELTSYFNADLKRSWNRSSYPGDDLSELPTGVQEFCGVRLDLQGVIQLQGGEWVRRGLQFPEAVSDIPVGRACRYLYALHADAGAKAPSGTTVANLVLHYTDGTTASIPIQHDVHVKDWWAYRQPPPSDSNTVVAWMGRNAATTRVGTSNRLYLTRFENPQPKKKVQTLDYVSAMAAPGPFMVALTVE